MLLRPQNRTMQFISQILITIQIAILVRRMVIIMSVGKIETLIYTSPSHPHTMPQWANCMPDSCLPLKRSFLSNKKWFSFSGRCSVFKDLSLWCCMKRLTRDIISTDSEREASKPKYQFSTDVTLGESNTNECLEKWSMKVLRKSLESPSETVKWKKLLNSYLWGKLVGDPNK